MAPPGASSADDLHAVRAESVCRAGKGRGIVARSAIKRGKLLLIESPVLFAEDEEGCIPDPDVLLDQWVVHTPTCSSAGSILLWA